MHERDLSPWKDDLDHYRQIGDMFCLVAEDYCHVPIDETTRSRWREMMPLIMEVDTYVDERIVPGLNTEQDLVDELESFERFRDRYPHLAPEVLGEQAWREMEQRAREAVGYFQAMAYATTYKEYVDYRYREGVATAELFSACATDMVRANPDFETVFMASFKQMVVSGCMFDSAGDLAKDVRQGRASLSPSLFHRGRLIVEGLKLGLPRVEMVRHESIRRALGRTATLYIDRHFKKSPKNQEQSS